MYMYVLNSETNWMLSSYIIDTSSSDENKTTTTIKHQPPPRTKKNLWTDQTERYPNLPPLTLSIKRTSLHPPSDEKIDTIQYICPKKKENVFESTFIENIDTIQHYKE